MTSRAIQISHLRAFVAVAQTGSFTRAAEVLGYTEPAVHLQMSALRRLLGGALVERGRGQMRLTQRGEQLLPFAERVVAEINAMVDQAKAIMAADECRLTAGIGRASASHVFPAIAGMFRQRHPEIDLDIRVIPFTDLPQRLLDGEVDVAFCGGLGNQVWRRADQANGIVSVPWSRSPFVLCGTRDSVARLTRRETTRVTVYLAQYAMAWRPLILRVFEAQGYDVQVEEAHDLAASMTAASLSGLAFVHLYAARHELALGRLVEFNPGVALPREIIYVAHKRPVTNPYVVTFIEFLRSVKHLPSIREILCPDDVAAAPVSGSRSSSAGTEMLTRESRGREMAPLTRS